MVETGQARCAGCGANLRIPARSGDPETSDRKASVGAFSRTFSRMKHAAATARSKRSASKAARAAAAPAQPPMDWRRTRRQRVLAGGLAWSLITSVLAYLMWSRSSLEGNQLMVSEWLTGLAVAGFVFCLVVMWRANRSCGRCGMYKSWSKTVETVREYPGVGLREVTSVSKSKVQRETPNAQDRNKAAPPPTVTETTTRTRMPVSVLKQDQRVTKTCRNCGRQLQHLRTVELN